MTRILFRDATLLMMAAGPRDIGLNRYAADMTPLARRN
jgi:hypothetical protein